MRADMPVAMIENASLPQQRECRSSLGAMAQDAAAFGLKSPAILVIGAVAAERMVGAQTGASEQSIPALLAAAGLR
ncbi:uroporphyrin-III C-methyltransferase [compost metagenome]